MKRTVLKTMFVVLCVSLLVLTFALGACDTDGEATLNVSFDANGVIYEGDDLQTVKSLLTVTYTDPQGNTQEVTDYSLSGTLREGTCEITVTYNGVSTTVRIDVSAVRQFTIRFVVDGETYDEKVIDGQSPIVLPSDPTKPDFTFVCWCYDIAGNSPFDANQTIESNVELYAKWQAVPKYVVKFVVDGIEFYSYSVNEGSQITLPETNPSATCKNFTGWVSQNNQPIDTNQTVNSELTFTATFETAHENEVTDIAVPASCLESGWTAGSHCERCGDVIVAQEEVPALGHDIDEHDAQAATCTEDGWYAWEECKRAGCGYTTYEGIEATGHDYGWFIDEDPAACEKEGEKGHYHCSSCNTDFDEDYQVLASLKIDALGHDVQHHDAQEPSCGSVGWNAYDTCNREGCDYTTYQEIPKKQHDMDENDKCKSCGYFDSGLELELLTSGDGYAVVGLGTFTGTDVVIPAANADGKPVMAIDSRAFKQTNITSIEIPASITSMGYYAFEDCAQLTKVNYLGTIDQWAQIDFDDVMSNPLCHAHNLYLNNVLVTEVKLTTATEVANAAFANCTSITSVELPAGITKIGPAVFSGCANLVSITIPEGVTKIDNFAFDGCTSLVSVTIPASVSTLCTDAFGGCEKLAKVNYLGTADQWAQIAFESRKANPTYYAKNLHLNDVLVTEAKLTTATKIRSYAFYNCASLKSIEISTSVTEIGSEVFYNCASLESIKIPENVTDISRELFDGCASLRSIEIPASVVSIGIDAFKGCNALAEVNYLGTADQWVQIAFIDASAQPLCQGAKLYFNNVLVTEVKLATTTKIGQYAFYKCTTLESLEIAASVTEIGTYAFYDCEKLASVAIAQNSQLATIGSDAFNSCTSLESITIPASVTKISSCAFSGCKNLATVSFAEDSQLASISDGVFKNCTSLKSITIPASAAKIGSSTFADCSGLLEITIPASVTELGYNAFYGCSGIEKVNYLGTIDQWARIKFVELANPLSPFNNAVLYVNNTPVTDVKLTTVTEISDYAFYGYDALLSVELSSSVTGIGDKAFYRCENLLSAKIPTSVTSIGTSVFSKSNALTIYCEIASKPSTWNNTWNESYLGYGSCSLPVVWDCKNTEVANDGSIYAVIEGVRYALKGEVATVAPQPKNIDSQTIIRPSVTYKGTSYAVTTIAAHAFEGNSNLVSVTIPSSVTNMGSQPFYGCNRLTIYCGKESKPSNWNSNWNYSRPVVWNYLSNETTDGGQIFATIDGIRYALIDDKAEVSFQAGSSASVEIPSTVTYKGVTYSVFSIREDAFLNCTSLESIKIPASIANIGMNAFDGCTNLSSIEIPASITGIGSYAFNGCLRLAIVNYLGTIDQWAQINFHNAYANPWYVAGKLYINEQLVTEVNLTSATQIGNYAFFSCSLLTNVTIPATVGTIGVGAFRDCTNLTNVVMAGDVTEISTDAFLGCTSLESITIPASVTRIGSFAFSSCNSLKKVNYLGTIDQWAQIAFSDESANPLYYGASLYLNDVLVTDAKLTATTIGKYAFYNCQSLTSLEIAASVTGISEKAFAYCSNLAMVTFAEDSPLASISNSVFKNCTSLRSISIPASVTSIADSAFSYCTGLAEVTIPASMENITSFAFSNCSGIEKVNYLGTIDQWVQIKFGNQWSNPLAFAKNLHLNNVLVTEAKLTSTTIDKYSFYNCQSLTSVEIAATVTSIGNYAFSGCANLATVTLDENSQLATIGDQAFSGCGKLASITIPASVTKVGNRAFDLCASLTINCEASSQPSGWKSSWNNSNCTVVWNCKNSTSAGEENA